MSRIPTFNTKGKVKLLRSKDHSTESHIDCDLNTQNHGQTQLDVLIYAYIKINQYYVVDKKNTLLLLYDQQISIKIYQEQLNNTRNE